MTEEHIKIFTKGPKRFMKDPAKFAGQVRRLFRLMPAFYRKRLSANLREWLIAHNRTIVSDKCTWMGVKAVKNPLDSWIYQELLYEVKPDVVVEIGSYSGGSTLYFAHLLEILGKGKVVSVDIDRSHYDARHERIVDITGDSSSAEVISKVFEQCEGKKAIVFHDGDHSKEAVLRELEAYSPLVSVGSYFVVEDGIVDLFTPGDGLGSYAPGPLAAVEEFLKTTSDFIIDESRERYVMTYNPRGYLKRVK
jgi:cephalosporin hydroxylase